MTSVAQAAWFQDPKLKRVFAALDADAGHVRVVGGAVRNSLMGVPVADIDLATTHLPETVIELAKTAGIKAVPTGIAHGTVTLVVEGKPFEVTTLRRDVATDGRHAEVASGTDWQEDANRRDFTINALYATSTGEVIDLVDGLADIETRTVRFIGDATTRISEDYLRILRFFRFFAYYGSGRPDADGLRACARGKSGLASLSAERVWSELKKLLSADDPGRALLWMRQSGVLTDILPETEKWGIDAIPGLVSTEKALKWPIDPMLRLAAIIPTDTDRCAALATRLRLSGAEAKVLSSWTRSPPITEKMADTAFDRLLYVHEPDGLVMRLKMLLAGIYPQAEHDADAMAKTAYYQRLLARAAKWVKPQFPVTGNDLIAKGIAPGPDLGAALSRLEKRWVEGNFNASKDDLLQSIET